MPDPESGGMAGTGTRHVHRNRPIDAGAQQRPAEPAVSPHLLGHRKNRKAVLVRLALEDACVLLDRVEVEHVGIGRDLPRLVQGDRGLDEARIAPSQNVQEHGSVLPSISGADTMTDVLRGNRPVARARVSWVFHG